MANERIIQINGGTALTRLRNSSDVMELDNSSSGSAQISVANVTGGVLMDYGVSTISTLASGYTTVYVFGFNSTLPSVPSYIEISIMCSSTGGFSAVFGNVIYNLTNTTGFQVLLSGPVPDGTHKLIWKAYA